MSKSNSLLAKDNYDFEAKVSFKAAIGGGGEEIYEPQRAMSKDYPAVTVEKNEKKRKL
jgi:hypothetical protein